MIRILMVGDVMGKPGRQAASVLLPRLRKKHALDLVVANGENAAGGFGLQPEQADELYAAGVDVLTSGNHAFDKREILSVIDSDPRMVRPANYPPGVPGIGSTIARTKAGVAVGVVNLMGRVYMPNLDCPFRVGDSEVAALKKTCTVIVVDMHAEVTSEKVAMGWHFDGRVTAVVGTHTHVQTADERVLPGGTAYLTDLGMTGPHDGVIGIEKEIILRKFLTQVPVKFEVARGNVQLQGALIEADETTGKAVSIVRVREPLPAPAPS